MNLKQHYQEKAVPQLMEEFGVRNPMAVPRITKVVVNMGLKEAAHEKTVLDKMGEQLAAITGQKAKTTRAKKAIANFKLRQGDPIGMTITLRGQRMYDFLSKLVTIVLPRVRDFQGVPPEAFDSRGNYTLGLSEQTVFGEIDYAKVDKTRGLEITIVTGGNDAKMARRLLELLGMPFKKNER